MNNEILLIKVLIPDYHYDLPQILKTFSSKIFIKRLFIRYLLKDCSVRYLLQRTVSVLEG